MDSFWSSGVAVAACAAVAALALSVSLLRSSRRSRRIEGMPGPRPRPLLGNVSELLQMDSADAFVDWTRRYGKIVQYSVGLGGGTHVLVCDADAARRILVGNARNYAKASSLLTVVRRIFGPRCMISLSYDDHEARRRVVEPAFKSRALAAMLPRVADLLRSLIAAWRAELSSSSPLLLPPPSEAHAAAELEVSVYERVAELTADALGTCVLGCELGCLGGGGTGGGSREHITQAIYRVMAVEDLSWLRLVPFYDYLPTAWNRNIRIVKRFAADLLHDRRKKAAAATAAAAQDDGDDDRAAAADRKQPGVLELMIAAAGGAGGEANGREALSDADIVDDVVQFLIAGHETLTGVLCWALLEVARRPEVQRSCRDEAARVLTPEPSTGSGDGRGKSGKQVRDGDAQELRERVGRLHYCSSVVKETLRLHTSVPLTVRTALGDDMLGGYRIPAGTNLTLAVAAMMRQPDYYQDPDRFWPERWLPDKDAATAAGAPPLPPPPPHFMPFLCGPSMCIGHKFAMLEMTLALAMLVRDLSFRPLAGVEYRGKQGLTHHMHPPLRLLLTKAEAHDAGSTAG